MVLVVCDHHNNSLCFFRNSKNAKNKTLKKNMEMRCGECCAVLCGAMIAIFIEYDGAHKGLIAFMILTTKTNYRGV